MRTINDIPEHRFLHEKLRKMVFVEANRELIARMEKKIQDKLAEIWGETV